MIIRKLASCLLLTLIYSKIKIKRNKNIFICRLSRSATQQKIRILSQGHLFFGFIGYLQYTSLIVVQATFRNVY